MAIQVADGFDLKSKKPLDGRIQYASVADMKAVPEANLYDGCTAYVTATKKKYTFDSTNTVDPTTGKWREDTGGGSETTELSDLNDVEIESPADGEGLFYDAETGKWINKASGTEADLSDLGDVEITDPSDGEVLSYDATEEKWKNVPNSSGGDPAVINGYAYVQPMTTIMDYINCINRMSDSDKQISVSDPTIFNGKGCTALYMFLGPSRAYLLFSEYGFTIDPYSLKKSGVYTYVSSRHATDETNHPGYRANSFTYANGISALESVTIKGTSEEDCQGIADNDKVGKLYYIGNVLFKNSVYDSNIVLIENPLLFYSDAAHTTSITPETGKIYVDIPTGKMYEWNGTEFTAVGGGDVPTKTSQLTNDSGFITKDVNNLTNYYKKTEIDNNKQNKLTEGDGIDITNDVISIDPMPAEDMSEVIDIRPTGGRTIVTGYVPLGTLISYYGETAPRFFLACDGATYNKSDYPELAEHLLSLTNHSQYEVDGDDTKFKVPDLSGEFLRGTGTNSHSGNGNGAGVGVHQDATEHISLWSGTSDFGTLISSGEYATRVDSEKTAIRGRYIEGKAVSESSSRMAHGNYTSRPTNTSVLFCIAYKDIYSNPMNDYSTDEKIVGTWIDGKTIYQRTFVDTAPSTATTGTIAEKYITIGASIDKVMSIKSIRDSGGYAWGEFPLTNPPTITTDTISSKTVVTSVVNLMMMAFVLDNNATSNANKIRVTNNCVTWNDIPIYITIQYTKTT